MVRSWADACSQLPSKDDAKYLVDANFRHLAWNGVALEKGAFGDCFEAIYANRDVEPATHSERCLAFQKLAWIFVVLSLGTLVSLELSPDDSAGQHYFEMSQQCLVMGRFLTFTTVIGVHTTVRKRFRTEAVS